MRSMNAGSIPTPLSATTKRKLAKPWGAPAFSATLMRTVLPAGEYLMALSTSWVSTWDRRTASTSTRSWARGSMSQARVTSARSSESTGDPAGSTATTWIAGFCAFR